LSASSLLIVHDAEAPSDAAQAAYVGESGNLGKRLQAHALDPSKSFATEVYVLAGFERRLDKEAAVHMQMRLRDLIKKAGVARLIGAPAPAPRISHPRGS
jgi:predicted GIY-YIG superfamily endonuclease